MRKVDQDGKMIVVLEDNSSNGTYYNGEKVSVKFNVKHTSLQTVFSNVLTGIVIQIGKGNFRELKNGDEILLLKEIEG